MSGMFWAGSHGVASKVHGTMQGSDNLGKIAGIDEIVVTRVPVAVEGPGFLSDLFGGNWAVQLVRAILFLMGAAVILGLFAATVVTYSFLYGVHVRN